MVNKRIKQNKIVSDDEVKVKNLIILLLSVVVICTGLYFLTDYVLNKDVEEESVKEVEINYDIATVGTMFNRIEDEYYVLMYSSKEDGSTFNSVLDSYRSSDNYVKTYFVDLDLKINNYVLKDDLVEKPTNSNEVSVKGATLFKINSGKVSECYSEADDIKDVLK